MKHYKIFFDTNQIRTAPDHGDLRNIFGHGLENLHNFLQENKKSIKTNKITICIPDIVKRECLQQRLEKIDAILEESNVAIERLSKLGHSKATIKPKKNYKKLLEEVCEEHIQKYNIELLPMPDLTAEYLIERAVNKIKPFNDNKAGFKDTLIFLSILEDAKKDRGDIYILCTKNASEFSEEVVSEFKKQTEKDLYVVEDMGKIQEKLDALVPLRLDLKKRNAKIKNFIESNSGSLIVEVNSAQEEDKSNPWLLATTAYETIDIYGNKNSKKEITGYNLKELAIKEIIDLGENKYKVSVGVVTNIKYKDDTDILVIPSYYGTFDREKEKTFDYNVVCDLGNEILTIEKKVKPFRNIWGTV